MRLNALIGGSVINHWKNTPNQSVQATKCPVQTRGILSLTLSVVGKGKMKQTITIDLAVVAVSAVLLAGESPPNIHPRMAELRAALPLPPGWDCVADHGCMVISRQKPVTLLNLNNLPASDSKEELLKEFGVSTPYQIVLLLRPQLSEEDLQKLKALRAKSANHARVNDDHKFSRSARISHAFLLPSYNYYGSSVCLHRTDEGAMEIYPEKAAKERDAILKAMDEFFKKRK